MRYWKPNEYLSKDLFNTELKDRFLERYESNTQRYYRNIFQRSFEMESQLNKDLCIFTFDQLDSLIKTYSNSSVQAIQGVISILKSYIDFAITDGKVKTGENLLQPISGYEYYREYLDINKTINKFITKKRMKEICEKCVNLQDALPFALPFYGVKGEQNEEIVNLKVKDVNFQKHILTLTRNDGSIRLLQVDEFLTDLIYEAINEDLYMKGNGGVPLETISDHYKIYDNDYVLRVASNKDNAPAHNLTVNSRIRKIGRILGNTSLTPMSIWNSGMYNKYKEIKSRAVLSDLDGDDFVKLGKEYGGSGEYWWKIKKKMLDYESVDL